MDRVAARRKSGDLTVHDSQLAGGQAFGQIDPLHG
jgi:hypothetical protein